MKHTKEPWNSLPIPKIMGGDWNSDDWKRACVCVDALADLPNPAAVKECVAALRVLLTVTENHFQDRTSWETMKQSLAQAKAALSALNETEAK